MAKKASTAKAGGHLHHERFDYEKLKSRPVISIGSTYKVVDEGIGKNLLFLHLKKLTSILKMNGK